LFTVESVYLTVQAWLQGKVWEFVANDNGKKLPSDLGIDKFGRWVNSRITMLVGSQFKNMASVFSGSEPETSSIVASRIEPRLAFCLLKLHR